MPEKDYSHRDIVDKLGVKPGQWIAFDSLAWPIEATLRLRILERSGHPADSAVAMLDLVLVTVNNMSDIVAALCHWKERIVPAGGIWLLSPKRGRPGYIDQRDLILAGGTAGLVDNKICSVSDEISGLRFVIRKAARPQAP